MANAKRQAGKAKFKQGLKNYIQGSREQYKNKLDIGDNVIGYAIGGPTIGTGYTVGEHIGASIKGKSKPTDAIKGYVQGMGQAIKGAGQMVKGIKDILFNHPAWYENYPLEGLVNLNFGYRNSVQNRVSDMIGIGGGNNDGLDTTVGTRIDVELTIPKDMNNTFGQAMQILYAKIRAANSGTVNFSVAQLAAYVLNLRSVRATLAWLRRAVSLQYITNPYDSDMPRMLVEMATGSEISITDGVNFETLTKHSADLHNYLQIWFNTVKSLCPLNIDLFDRTDWMFSNVFKDSDDVKCNYYVMTMSQVPLFTVDNTGKLTATFKDLTPATGSWEGNYETLLNNINAIINTMVDANVNSIIAGDILKAFGSDAFYSQDPFIVGQYIAPIYDEAALTQIQNSSVLCAGNGAGFTLSYTLSSGTEYESVLNNAQSVSIVTQNPTATLVNTYKSNITGGEAISYTRLQFSGTYTDSNDTMKFETCGFEIVRNVKYYFTREVANGVVGYDAVGWNDLNGSWIPNAARVANGWSIMDWSPMLLLVDNDASALLWDFNNYAICSKSQLNQMHQYATLSLLAVGHEISRQNSFKFSV